MRRRAALRLPFWISRQRRHARVSICFSFLIVPRKKMKHSPMCALPSERRGNGEAKARGRGRGRGRRRRGAFRWWRRRGRRQRAGECDLPFFRSIFPAIAHLDCLTAFTSMQRQGGSGGVGSEEGGEKDVGGNGDKGAARRARTRRSNCRRQ